MQACLCCAVKDTTGAADARPATRRSLCSLYTWLATNFVSNQPTYYPPAGFSSASFARLVFMLPAAYRVSHSRVQVLHGSWPPSYQQHPCTRSQMFSSWSFPTDLCLNAIYYRPSRISSPIHKPLAALDPRPTMGHLRSRPTLDSRHSETCQPISEAVWLSIHSFRHTSFVS